MFWKTMGIVPLELKVVEAMLPKPLHREDFHITDYDNDTAQVIDLQGLEPDTRYGYLLYSRRPEADGAGP